MDTLYNHTAVLSAGCSASSPRPQLHSRVSHLSPLMPPNSPVSGEPCSHFQGQPMGA